MKKLIFLILFFVMQVAISQTLTGNIYDAETNEPLVGVSVYFDGTTLSSTTDAKGAFSIKLPQGLNKPLVFSYIGYEKVVVEDPGSIKARLKVLMKASTEMLDEVVIKGKTIFSRKQMLRAFRKQFLGDNKGGNSCKIENEGDIQLYYNSQTHTLHAEAKKPIRITNKHLKYEVNFELADFQLAYFSTSLDESELASSFYAGTTFFKDKSEKGNADKKRRQAYRGSTAHLMRAIYNNDLEKQGFVIYVDKLPMALDSCFTVTDSLTFKKLTVRDLPPPPLPEGITLSTNMPQKSKRDFTRTGYVVMYKGAAQSTLKFNQRDFYIDERGLFFPIEAILFSGYMGSLKAGDLLPDDYEYTETD